MRGKSIVSENRAYRRVKEHKMTGKYILSETSAYKRVIGPKPNICCLKIVLEEL